MYYVEKCILHVDLYSLHAVPAGICQDMRSYFSGKIKRCIKGVNAILNKSDQMQSMNQEEQ